MSDDEDNHPANRRNRMADSDRIAYPTCWTSTGAPDRQRVLPGHPPPTAGAAQRTPRGFFGSANSPFPFSTIER